MSAIGAGADGANEVAGRRTVLPLPCRILGIETSCDETAAAVVVDGRSVLSSVVSSQVDLHARFGGVVPEVASRAHVELLNPVVAEAMVEAGLDGRGVDAVAATVGPGLVGALLVGVSAAKAFALSWGVPFVGVNHLEAHLYAAFLEEPDLAPPLVLLLVSGGHTLLVAMDDHLRYRLLGSTIDDAAETGVQVDLARHDRRRDPGAVDDDGRGRLVARRLDPEDRLPGAHGHHAPLI